MILLIGEVAGSHLLALHPFQLTLALFLVSFS